MSGILMDHLPFHETLWEDDQATRRVRWYYWRQGSQGIYIVACVSGFKNADGEFEARDWAAYIGCSEAAARRERDGWREALEHGCKLWSDLAKAAFQDFAPIPYRT